jgi:hypothetical protein
MVLKLHGFTFVGEQLADNSLELPEGNQFK